MKLRTELAESKVAMLCAVDLLIMRKLSKINSFSNVKCQQKLATLIKANYTIEGGKKKDKEVCMHSTSGWILKLKKNCATQT